MRRKNSFEVLLDENGFYNEKSFLIAVPWSSQED